MNKEIYKWLNEILNKKPETFNEYFYDEIGEYLDISNESDFYERISQSEQPKLILLRDCKSKSEVQAWLHRLTSYISKRLDIENIIEDYIV